MELKKLSELLQQIGVNTKKFAKETCHCKDIESDRSIVDMTIDLDDGETVVVEFGSRWCGDGNPEMHIELADVITPEATEAAIERELSAYNEKQEAKRKQAEENRKAREAKAEEDEKAEFERLKKKFEGEGTK